MSTISKVSEVRMSPSTYTQAMSSGKYLGVKIGFEWEVCVPLVTILNNENSSGDLKLDLLNNWFNYLDSNSVSIVHFPPRLFDKIFKPIDNSRTMTDMVYELLENEIKIARELYSKIPVKYLSKKTISDIYKDALVGTERGKRGYFNQFMIDDDKLISLYTQIQFASRVFIGVITDKKFLADANTDLRNDLNDAGNNLLGSLKLNYILSKMGGYLDPAVFIKKYDFDPKKAINLMINNDVSFFDEEESYQKAAQIIKSKIVNEFNRKVVIFDSYHEEDKDLDKYYIEPDGSLQPNGGDASLEIVSFPMRPDQAISDLKNFYRMSNDLDLYTNDSTGLHINVSIPRNLDVLKLAVFLGDNYVLKKWDRENNQYADEVFARIKKSSLKRDLSLDDKGMKMLLDIAKSTSKDHTASISYNGEYVSFRHAGGDYLKNYGKVVDTIGRFVRAMIIASDYTAYREEYFKKLSMFINQDEASKLKKDQSQGYSNNYYNMLNAIKNRGIAVVDVIIASLKPFNKNITSIEQIPELRGKFTKHYRMLNDLEDFSLASDRIDVSTFKEYNIIDKFENNYGYNYSSSKLVTALKQGDAYYAMFRLYPIDPSGFIILDQLANEEVSNDEMTAVFLASTMKSNPHENPLAKKLIRRLIELARKYRYKTSINLPKE